MFGWSGSSAIGGLVVELVGIVPLFAVTGCVQLVGTIPLALGFRRDIIEKPPDSSSQNATTTGSSFCRRRDNRNA